VAAGSAKCCSKRKIAVNCLRPDGNAASIVLQRPRDFEFGGQRAAVALSGGAALGYFVWRIRWWGER